MQKVIHLGHRISMKIGTKTHYSIKNMKNKYFCSQLRVAMENAILKFP